MHFISGVFPVYIVPWSELAISPYLLMIVYEVFSLVLYIYKKVLIKKH